MIKQHQLDKLQALFKQPEPVQTWKQQCLQAIIRPEGTGEFDDLIEKQMERFKECFTPDEAANYISKTINILYYQRHPAKHMQMLMAIL